MTMRMVTTMTMTMTSSVLACYKGERYYRHAQDLTVDVSETY